MKTNSNEKVLWRSTLMVAMAVMVGVTMSGCRKKGGQTQPPVDPLYHAWYSVYKDANGVDQLTFCKTGLPEAGCDWYSDGTKIFATDDKYYTDANWDNQVLYADWEYYDDYGNLSYYEGWAWLSDSGILYDEFGNALNEDDGSESRDMIADQSIQAEKTIKAAGKAFAKRYNLAADKGVKIARALHDYATLGKKRGRTEADLREFTARVAGVKYETALAALDAASQGDMSSVESLNKEVATNWGTDPETSKEILKNWLRSQISE